MMKKALFCLPPVSALIALALLSAAEAPKLPPPYHTPSTPNPARVVAQGDHKLQAPAGFVVEEFASGFAKPRIMLELPGGAILVSDSVAKGAVWAIAPDRSKKQLLTGLDRPFGLAFNKGYLYVAEAEAIKRYKFDPRTLAAGADEEIIPLKGYGKGHWSRSLAFDKKGARLYVSVGSGSNVDLGDPKDRNAINVYNPDGTGHEIMATGLRNPVSIRWNPQSGKLWTTVQERDGLGDDLVPDFFTSITPGAFYGWPYAYIGANEEPRHKGAAPDMVKKAVVPDVVLKAHASVMDFAFYTGKMFPAKYRNGAFIVYRGSSNRAKRLGYEVVFLPFKNGRPAADAPEQFVHGWMLGEDQKEVWGRPVGILQLADGSLLVSEDGNNKIFRISFKG